MTRIAGVRCRRREGARSGAQWERLGKTSVTRSKMYSELRDALSDPEEIALVRLFVHFFNFYARRADRFRVRRKYMKTSEKSGELKKKPSLSALRARPALRTARCRPLARQSFRGGLALEAFRLSSM